MNNLYTHTKNIEDYNDPMKVLHNTVFPEDSAIYDDEFNPEGMGRWRKSGPPKQGKGDPNDLDYSKFE